MLNNNLLINDNTINKQTTNTGKSNNFLSYLKSALYEVDTLQKEAQISVTELVLGEEEYLHNTMLAYEKASLALQLTIEVRNKLVEAYQEIMRIQM